mgnify:CR=1 FL=1
MHVPLRARRGQLVLIATDPGEHSLGVFGDLLQRSDGIGVVRDGGFLRRCRATLSWTWRRPSGQIDTSAETSSSIGQRLLIDLSEAGDAATLNVTLAVGDVG